MRKRGRWFKKLTAMLLTVALACSGMPTGFLPLTETVKADAVVELYGSGLKRESPDAASMYIRCTQAGTPYYYVTVEEDVTDPSYIVSRGKAADAIVADTVTGLTLQDGVSSGAKNVYVVVKKADETFTNIVKIRMPYDYCNIEDFSAYPAGITGEVAYNVGFNVEGSRTIELVDGNPAYAVKTQTGMGTNRIHYTWDSNSVDVVEADVRFTAASPTALLALDKIGVGVYKGKWYLRRNDDNTWADPTKCVFLNHTDAVKDIWYQIRFVYDRAFGKIDVFIDGNKVNEEPFETAKYDAYALSMESANNETTYFDNIRYYRFRVNTPNATVDILPKTAHFTRPQTVTLSSTMPGKTYIFTTDGSYPEYGKGTTLVYDSNHKPEIPADSPTVRIRALGGVMEGSVFKAESIAREETYTFSSAPIIKGMSVQRTNADSVACGFYSDVAGEIYYYVGATSTYPEQLCDATAGWKKAEATATQDTATTFSINGNGLTSGPKYVTVCLMDKDGIKSNVLQSYLPYNYYVFDDFSAIPIGATAGSAITGIDGNHYAQEVDGNPAYLVKSQGSILSLSSWDSEATNVVDLKVRFNDEDPSASFAFDHIGIGVAEGNWYLRKNAQDTWGNPTLRLQPDFAPPKAVPDRWYRIRFVYDRPKKCYDVYVDNKKINDAPIKTSIYDYYDMTVQVGASESLYLDDICHYKFKGTAEVNANVIFDPRTAKYTDTQFVTLTTQRPESSAKVIYYTTDGNYPNPTESNLNTGSTVRYTEPIAVSTDTTIRAISGYMDGEVFKAESVPYEEIYSFGERPVISGLSVNRYYQNEANCYFSSDVAGEVYYYVSANEGCPDGEDRCNTDKGWIKSETVANQDQVTKITIVNNGLSAGAKHISVCLKDQQGHCSNVLTNYLPYDYCVREDFSAYPVGIKTGGYNVSFNDNRTIEEVEGNPAYAIKANSQDSTIGLDGINDYNGNYILEAKMRFADGSPTAYMYFDFMGIGVDQGKWYLRKNDQNTYNDASKRIVPDYDPGLATADKWYTIRLVFDRLQGKSGYFDAYIDGKKINDEPIETSHDYYHSLNLNSINGCTVYFDDIYLYKFRTNTKDAIVHFSPESAKYTKPQTLILTTTKEDRTIYYTLDGSVPNPTASNPNPEKTILYDPDDKPTLSGSCKVRAIAGVTKKVGNETVFLPESVVHEADYEIVDGAKITGGTIFRESADKATIYLKSDMAGELYYLVSESADAPEAESIEEKGDGPTEVAADKTYGLEVTNNVNIRSRYIYAVLKDQMGVYSNVLTYKMPSELYYRDEFEACCVGSNTGALATYSFGFWNTDATGNMAYEFHSGNCRDPKVMTTEAHGSYTLSCRVYSEAENPTFAVGLGSDSDFISYLLVQDGIYKCYRGTHTDIAELDLFAAPERRYFPQGKWTDVKLELHTATTPRTFDIYIDGEKANSEPMTTTSTTNTLKISFEGKDNQIVRFDDIEFYQDCAKVDIPRVNTGLVYNGQQLQGITYDEEQSAYTVTGDVKATEPGVHKATFTLLEGYVWADNTKAPREVSWSIAPKPLTTTYSVSKTYDGNDEALIKPGELIGVVTKTVGEGVEAVETKEDVSIGETELAGYYADRFVGDGIEVHLLAPAAFTLTGTDAAHYVLADQSITGTILPAAQTLSTIRTLYASQGQTLRPDVLRTAVKGSKGTLAFTITEGSAYASIAESGLVTNAGSAGNSVKVKATATALDMNGDDVPEYAANTDGAIFSVVITDKERQFIVFQEEDLTVEQGTGFRGQKALTDTDDGGKITYSSDDPSIAQVDPNTGEITIIEPGVVTITAIAAETGIYNGATASYRLEILGKKRQKLSFEKSELTVEYNEKSAGQKAINDKADGASASYVSSNETVVTVDPVTGILTVVGLGDATITASAPETARYIGGSATYKVTVTKAKTMAPSTTEVTKKDETYTGDGDGIILGLTEAMEYRREGESVYTPITVGTLEKLAPGTYYVRYKETAVALASEDLKLVIAAGKEKPKPEPQPEPEPAPEPEPVSEIDDNVPVEVQEAVIVKTDTDKDDVAGTHYQYMQVKAKVKKTAVTLSWKPIKGADGYMIYGANCGSKMEKIAEVTGGNTKKWAAKNLQKGTYYKYMVVAYRNTEKGPYAITSAKSVHVVTDGGKNVNPTGLKLKTKSKLSLKVKKKARIKAVVLSKKKLKSHFTKFRYESDNEKVATVDKKGTIKAVGKGKATIYVYIVNGISKKIKVTVK
ncbi:MAG: Ig-like domain-containing protein [Lachnospiraceae bacterium]|nr:Ig-like domain-containing protein [Lachnospiraceae bacterium]